METTGTITLATSIIGIGVAAALAMRRLYRGMRQERLAQLADEKRRERELEVREQCFEAMTGRRPGKNRSSS